VRRLAPWGLLLLLAVGTLVGAILGRADAHPGTAHPADASGARPSQFVGLTVEQAEQVARSQGIAVRIWRVPASAPHDTVMEEVSSRPAFLVVSDGPPKNRMAVLPHAVGPPVHPECAPGFRLEADGNAGPATCSDSAVNVATWDYLAASVPPLLGLGRGATKCAVARAYHDDQLTGPMNYTVFQLARAYYGWRFDPAFVDQLVGSGGGAAAGCTGG
jgi:hypothetical protein